MVLWSHPDGGLVADAACWSMFAVTTIVVILRIISRAGFGANYLGLDDYITIFCLSVTFITCVLISVGSSYGLGKHAADLSPEDLVMSLKYNVIVSAVLIWTFSLPKFAIVAILKRILNYGTKTTIAFWGLAISSQACIFATSIWWFKQCTPVEHGWNPAVPGTCANVNVLVNLGYFTSAYSAFLDLFFAFYPVPLVMKLNMALKKRIAVCCALSLSALAFTISIYKLTIFPAVFQTLAVDPTFPVPYLDILGLAEGCILIICASLPTLGPLIRATKAKFDSQYGTKNSSRNRFGSNTPQHTGNDFFGKGWRAQKGHRLDDPERSIDTKSTDGIPLVTSPRAENFSNGDIHKTVEISVTRESADQGSRRPSNHTGA